MNFNYSGISGKSSIFSKQMILRKRELEKAEETEKEQNNSDNKTNGNSPEVPALPTASNTFMSSAEYVRLLTALEDDKNEGADNIVNNTEQPVKSETALPNDLENAIESGDIDKIKAELDKLGISYEKTKDTSKDWQNAYIITFSYNGQDYKVPCKVNMEYQVTSLNNKTDLSEPTGRNSTTMHRDFILKQMGFTEDQINQYFDKIETPKRGQMGGTHYVLRSDLQVSVTDDEGITSLKTITSAEELKEYLDNKTEIGTSLPENLTEAINTGDIKIIISELAAMEIPYDTEPEPGKAQVYEVVTFNYEGKDYEIHSKFTSIELNMQSIDSSVEGQLKSIVSALEKGGRQKLEQLDELGIEYDIKEGTNGGYTVTFSYEGVDYEATYTPVEIPEPEPEHIDPAFMDFIANFINANINKAQDRVK